MNFINLLDSLLSWPSISPLLSILLADTHSLHVLPHLLHPLYPPKCITGLLKALCLEKPWRFKSGAAAGLAWRRAERTTMQRWYRVGRSSVPTHGNPLKESQGSETRSEITHHPAAEVFLHFRQTSHGHAYPGHNNLPSGAGEALPGASVRYWVQFPTRTVWGPTAHVQPV